LNKPTITSSNRLFKDAKTSKSIAIFLTLLMATSAVLLIQPTAFAQYTPMPDRDTFTSVGVTPSLIGLGQELTINVMVYPGPAGPTYEAQSIVQMVNEGIPAGFANISVTITKPDGTEETFKPVDISLHSLGINEPGRMQIVGHLMFNYKPAAIGNYSITASFPGQIYTTDYVSNTIKLSVLYKPSSSTKATVFQVQENWVSGGLFDGSPWSPLPENYWENPVQTDNREWYAIAGDWVQSNYDRLGSNYNPYSKAPNSPHILYSREVADSALIGGIWESLPLAQSSGQYNALSYGGDPIIVDGNIYRNHRNGYFECVDLRTGARLWEAAGNVALAQRLDLPFQTAAQTNEGAISSWLWGGITISTTGTGSDKWYRYNTFNGDLMQTITNVPRDLSYVGFEDGDPIIWCVQSTGYGGNLWNTTLPLKIPYVNLIKWNFSQLVSTKFYSQATSNDWRAGIMWNVSAMQGDLVSIGDSNFRAPLAMPYRDANVVVVRNPNAMQIMAGYDYTTGRFLWKNNATVLNIDILLQGVSTSNSGPMIMLDSGSNTHVAYDVKTATEIWRASRGELPWSMVPAYTYVYHDGTWVTGSFDGYVRAYNINDGKLIWTSEFAGQNNENVVGTNPFNGRSLGADGKLYYSSATEYQLMPRTRFQHLICINETTGQFIWKLPIGISPRAIADGYLLGEDMENGIQYVLGKGKTAVTVSSPDMGVAFDRSVMITGTVMDQSPGKPNTPAVSEADMSEWMDYLYGQNATLINNPPSPTGVLVTITVKDANGNYRTIGQTTSNSEGFYKLSWTPDIPGDYEVYASFAGSESYWPSHAITAFSVETAAATPAPTQPIGQPAVEQYFIPAVVGIGILIVACFALTLLILKKRP
jgi:outer membrane protein assembly factor BamB